MKSQLKKLTAIFLSICVVLSLTSVISFAADTTATYTFSNYTGSVQYAEEQHELDDNLTLDIKDCHINTQLRIYSSASNNGRAILKAAGGKKISALGFNAGYKKDTLNVYGSNDEGATWTLIEGVATATSYKDYTVAGSFGDGYQWIKLDVVGTSQVRVASITVTLVETNAACEHTNTTEERTETTVDALGSVVVTCDDCGKEISNETLGADVTYVVPKGETVPEGETDVTKVTLPEPNALPAEYADKYEFVGWAKADFEATTIEPDVIAAGTEVELTGHTTFYAVYTYSATATSGVKEYVLTDIADIATTDKFVITMTKSGTVYALTSINGSSSAPPANKTVTIESNKITSEVDDEILWTVETGDDGYVFYPNGDTTKWLYTTNANNGVRVGTNENKYFTVEDTHLKNTATSRYIGVYNTQDWRCYTTNTGTSNVANQTLGLYVATAIEGTVTYYTTSLGSVDGASVDVGSDLTMNFYVDDEKLTAPKMTFTMDGETVTVETKNAEGAFAFEGVPPHCMTEIITANLYDGDKLIATKEYSVQKNIQDLLNGGALTADQKQFVSNMLHYGDAAQNYKGNNDVLATEGVENLLAATTELPTKSDVAISGTVTDVAYFKSANVWFDNVNKLIVKFNELPENAKLLVNGTEVSFDGVSYMTDGILASDFGKIYNFTIANEQGEELQTLTYSVNSYVYAKKDSATMQELVTALYNYGLYAEKLV